ncbi:Tex-like N-terminal domain-containing protein [Mycoplasma nasistruthionis]|uniref:S1 RNA-binding domain-containing protein n=1 Tax=Mycoplasma nasistruthionis TaxID=353852 RepID=A0A4Y6I6W0_9MOLU|nr:Tex-like N-terminal domain-containing protein [Mycoplasma nasistruthionis]QDF65050.1 S1 RNA-binding domain-containing protein [Mycoplasma nasistruthionis]
MANKNPNELVAKELNITVKQVEVVLEMLNQGDTVPFISRYRKELTGGLNEEVIYKIEETFKYKKELLERQESIIKILTEKDLLTEDLKNKILNTQTKSELEALYEPFKVGKVTKASKAIELGLEPLAKAIFENKNPKFDRIREAKKYVDNANIPSVEFALENANYIIAQWISQDFNIRETIKQNIIAYGTINTSKGKKIEEDTTKKFQNYYEYKIPIKYIKNHNVLAINRAEKLGYIKVNFDYKQEYLEIIILKVIDKSRNNKNNVYDALKDSLKRLILPSIEREIFSDLFEVAQSSAIQIFSNNVEKLLKAPAVSGHNILAIDPAFVNGCKLAALSENGEVKGIDVIYPNEPRKQVDKAREIMTKMIKQHNIDIIVIGNGTASRETERFVADLIKHLNLNIKYAIVSEVGASVYSASQVAIEEFPTLSVEQRSAINIGRKFLDPLNELVKIDPKSIGVGQYQHDVNQKELESYLNFKVNKVVNETGVDLNTATKAILTYVAGLSKRHAQNIIDYRNSKKNPKFESRDEVKKVAGIGAKTFEQCIGFLRIFNSDNFLDKTIIHPESYKIANKIIKDYNLELDERGIDVSSIKIDELVSKYNIDQYLAELILKAFASPIKLISDQKEGFILKDSLTELSDLKIGTKVKGTVENITDFGIFLYIGLKQSLFVHQTKLKLEPNQSIYEKYLPGEILEIEITEIDPERNRLSGVEI